MNSGQVEKTTVHFHRQLGKTRLDEMNAVEFGDSASTSLAEEFIPTLIKPSFSLHFSVPSCSLYRSCSADGDSGPFNFTARCVIFEAPEIWNPPKPRDAHMPVGYLVDGLVLRPRDLWTCMTPSLSRACSLGK